MTTEKPTSQDNELAALQESIAKLEKEIPILEEAYQKEKKRYGTLKAAYQDRILRISEDDELPSEPSNQKLRQLRQQIETANETLQALRQQLAELIRAKKSEEEAAECKAIFDALRPLVKELIEAIDKEYHFYSLHSQEYNYSSGELRRACVEWRNRIGDRS